MATPRLIIVPQYPARMRYQSWWPDYMVLGYRRFFYDVVMLTPPLRRGMREAGDFAPHEAAVAYELDQIKMYTEMDIKDDDTLLLCDISYPGLFSSVLYHNRPRFCYAICHGTSRNRYDCFTGDRRSKWKVETGHSHLFNKVFVATNYHKLKLGWDNCHVVKFPLPPRELYQNSITRSHSNNYRYERMFCSVARPSRQKVNYSLEMEFGTFYNFTNGRFTIHRFCDTGMDGWPSYYDFLASSKYLIVTSREETYGYQVIDAMAVGTIPLAPRALSYPELLPPEYLYQPGNVESLLSTYYVLERSPFRQPKLWEDTFIEDTAKTMLGGFNEGTYFEEAGTIAVEDWHGIKV